MDISRSRCFSLLSHVDHGKSTLADRILELCHAVDARSMREQYLDTMDLERERGITIKAQNVRLHWRDYWLHLIDTPGHVDFGYEVSRSLAACEGAVLLVDASQGIEAQTLANCYAALEANLTIVGVLNKIDLPQAEPDRRAEEIERVLGLPADELLRISAKTGEGVPELLDAVVDRIPAPSGDPDGPLRALLFDSFYDSYRGVVSSVRVFDGSLVSGARLRYVHAGAVHDAEEVGVRTPRPTPVAALGPGEVGYLIAGIKEVRQARVGETITTPSNPGEALPGYRDPKPMVFCGLYPVVGDEYANLRDALEKLQLNDSSFTYEPETSGALGFGFRCGFLGLLHMEIVRERLEREYDLSLVATAPNVEYQVHLTNGEVEIIDNPSAMPPPSNVAQIEEPYVTVTMLTPTDYVGPLMELSQARRGEMTKLEYLSEERVELRLRAAAGRDRHGLLRPHEVPHPRLREPRLRAGRLPALRPRQGRRAPEPGARRRVLDRRAPPEGPELRAPDDRAAPRADPPPALRRADPSHPGRAGHRPGDGEGQAQGRPRQVLRRGRDPQAQAARPSEGREAADEADRTGRGAPGGLRRRAPTRRAMTVVEPTVAHPAAQGVYVHVPFCAHRCDYCDFATWTDRSWVLDDYVDACVTDLRRRVARGELTEATSVFFGGGTPSLLDAAPLLRILDQIPRPRDAEVTVECNPDTVDVAKLAAYAAGGVTRLSFGVQSMRAHVLAALGRTHQPANVRRAVDAARTVGLDHFNLDLIYGADGETLDDWRATLDETLALDPPHVSAYALTIEPGTPLGRRVAGGLVPAPDDDDQAAKYELADTTLGAAGLDWYEISNWSRPGHECRHNLLYWAQGDYLGIGAAAHGHRHGVRSWNVRTPERYVDRIRAGADPDAGSERLDPATRAEERLVLALRTRGGVAPHPDAADQVKDLTRAGFLAGGPGRVGLTRRGRLLANEVTVRLLNAGAAGPAPRPSHRIPIGTR